jgi:cyclopropane fatty-acyl-phospholipid synthase-like methyltransferase
MRAWRSSIERTTPRAELYDADYYAQLEPSARASASAIAESVVRRFGVRSVIDVGCGDGTLAESLQRLGVHVVGFDASEAAVCLARARGVDARLFDVETHEPPGVFCDLVVSLEVAEHLRPEAADRLVGLLAGLSNTVLFTAATPGQMGKGHLNEQPLQYWEDRFFASGFLPDVAAACALREEWRLRGVASWYWASVSVFTRACARPGRT